MLHLISCIINLTILYSCVPIQCKYNSPPPIIQFKRTLLLIQWHQPQVYRRWSVHLYNINKYVQNEEEETVSVVWEMRCKYDKVIKHHFHQEKDCHRGRKNQTCYIIWKTSNPCASKYVKMRHSVDYIILGYQQQRISCLFSR